MTEETERSILQALEKINETLLRIENKISIPSNQASLVDDPPLTLAEVAKYLQVTETTVRNYINRRLLIKFGEGRPLVLKSDLERFVKETRIKSREEINKQAAQIGIRKRKTNR